MTKEEFLKKHNLNETDYKNLQRYEQVRLEGQYNMFGYMALMIKNNLNGGKKMVDFIRNEDNYGDFLETLKEK